MNPQGSTQEFGMTYLSQAEFLLVGCQCLTIAHERRYHPANGIPLKTLVTYLQPTDREPCKLSYNYNQQTSAAQTTECFDVLLCRVLWSIMYCASWHSVLRGGSESLGKQATICAKMPLHAFRAIRVSCSHRVWGLHPQRWSAHGTWESLGGSACQG